MKVTTILSALLASAVVVVEAKSCHRGGSYCGSSLLRRGNYRDHIVETLGEAGKKTDEEHILKSRFSCLSGGDIKYEEYCSKGCSGTWNDDPDSCI